jgi:hypothetical protein
MSARVWVESDDAMSQLVSLSQPPEGGEQR